MEAASRMKSSSLGSQILRFIGAGLLNTVFGYGVYAVAVLAGWAPEAALLTAFVGGVVFNYFTTGRLVFRGHATSTEFLKFVAAYVGIYGVNVLLLRGILAFGIGPLVAQAASLPIIVALTFLVMKLVVFRR
jgi:putative flippase GtrA